MASNKTLNMSLYMTVKGARKAIDFYVAAFDAEEIFALVDPSDGRIGHAEIKLGAATLMISDEYPDFGAVSPETLGGSPVKMQVQVEDADAAFKKALELGATEVRPMKDQFYGARSGMLVDPFGHSWMVSTQKAEVSPEEMQRRWNESMKG